MATVHVPTASVIIMSLIMPKSVPQAPEVLLGEIPSLAADVWSYGIVCECYSCNFVVSASSEFKPSCFVSWKVLFCVCVCVRACVCGSAYSYL
jgi:hypothetical protein